MTNNDLYLELAAELMKKNVQSKKVHELCQRLKIPYNGDDVELMTYLLGSGMISKQAKSAQKTKKTNHDINL